MARELCRQGGAWSRTVPPPGYAGGMTSPSPAAPAARVHRRVHRVEVRPTHGDPRGDRLRDETMALGFTLDTAATARVYLIEADLDEGQLTAITRDLLSDPVIEAANVGIAPATRASVEVHPLPGVMDPAAQSVANAIYDLLAARGTPIDEPPAVTTGWRYDLAGVSPADAESIASRLLANAVVHAVHTDPFHPESLPKGHAAEFVARTIPLRDLDDDALAKLSRSAHLFLSLDEMRAIRDEYQTLGREPTDIELETLAQTWSEHCVHKTLKATVRYTGPANDIIDWTGRPGVDVAGDGSVTIHNMLRSTVAAATHELIAEGIDWTLSVFVDNAGIVRFDEDTAVCIKVETHNHPSALEPYGGAATGIGGCIRDIIGTGLAAKPIASTDTFCVAPPTTTDVPAGCLHPKRILTEVVAGVRDYGNRIGIPTLHGSVHFDDRYIGNPLVYCGCIGVMPIDLIEGDAQPGDLIVALGGRTGRDGIHGATFSSAELTDAHADEFGHAVQIGNAIEEKRVLDAILAARDQHDGPLFSSITDCGAGGFSSAVGEMGEKIGADVQLDRAPLKYDGLTYTEIWISEAQERMVLAVPQGKLDRLQVICDTEHVELAVLGTFGTDNAELILRYHEHEVGRLPMAFMHDGIPMPTRDAKWDPGMPAVHASGTAPSIDDALLKLLGDPNIASKHAIIRQYDHEVQGNTVVKPLVGPMRRGPSDAAVIQPVPGRDRGLAISSGLATGLGDPRVGGDTYLMALAAIDEAIRNLVCGGADPTQVAILDNFCWPSCEKPANLASLTRACIGCYDGAKAYRTPFVSGKDSLNNQFTTQDGRTIEIPCTLLITGMGIVESLDHCVTSDAKTPGNVLLLIGDTTGAMGGSLYQATCDASAGSPTLPAVDLERGPATARAVHSMIRSGFVLAAHDCSDGGLLCAIAEILIAGSTPDAPIGASVDLASVHADPAVAAFAESPARYVIEVTPQDAARIADDYPDLAVRTIATLDASGSLSGGWTPAPIPVETLASAWRAPLDW